MRDFEISALVIRVLRQSEPVTLVQLVALCRAGLPNWAELGHPEATTTEIDSSAFDGRVLSALRSMVAIGIVVRSADDPPLYSERRYVERPGR